MKEGWTYKKLGEVANFICGYTPGKKEISTQGEYPYFKVAEMNIAGNELFMRNTSLFVNSPKRIYPKGSIIFPKNGGAIYTEKKRILEVDSVIDLNTEALYPTDQVELMYLFYLLTFTKISSFDKGGGLPSLDLKRMSASIIPVPPLSEQKSIVDYLDSAFAKIDSMKANAEKALNEAKALFQASLNEMLEPKEGWELYKLKDICTHIVDCPHTTPKKSASITNYPCIRTSELRGGEIEWSSMQYLDENEYQKRISRLAPIAEDIVYGREGTYGDAVLLPEGYCFSLGQRTMLLRANKKFVIPKFLLKMMISTHVYNQAKAQNSGCGVGHVNVGDIKLFNIYLPPLADQQQIVSYLDSLKFKVDRLQENFDKISQECDALKQAILRQVFE